MVLAGQFLERPALVTSGGVVLEALFHRGRKRPALLVCPPEGGGGMDSPAVAELAWAAARAGHASLRFQHRGVGASQGARDPHRAVEDALAALRHLAETVRVPVAVAGVGSGSRTALGVLAAAAPDVEIAAAVLVAPEAVPAGAAGTRVLAVLPAVGAAVGADGLAAALGPAGSVEVVDGADASWSAGLPRVGRVVVEWIGRGGG